MPDTYVVRITPRALSDLEAIFEYIRRDSPQNASAMIARLLDAVDGLNILPHRFDVPRVGMVRGAPDPLDARAALPRPLSHR